MSDAGLRVLDGTQLSTVDLHFPATDAGAVAGARVLELAESRASQSMYGVSLPENLKSSALKRIHVDDLVDFEKKQVELDQAERFLKDYITAIADELRDDPLVVSILDGSAIRMFLEDEDDFAMLAENLFTDLDTEDEGKLSKSEIQNALSHMGVEMGVPPFSEFPILSDLLKKHGAEGEEKLGQSQFAQLLQPILQDLADALALDHVTVIQNIKIVNGSKLKKLLGDDTQLNDITEKVHQEKQQHSQKGQGYARTIRTYLEKNCKLLGLPPPEANESVTLLYDTVFADVDKQKGPTDSEKTKLRELVKTILEKFVEQLEASPVFLELEN